MTTTDLPSLKHIYLPAAFLAAHPDVSFSTRKELHYFSNEKHWKKGIAAGYLGAFKHWNYSDPQWTSSPPMYVIIIGLKVYV